MERYWIHRTKRVKGMVTMRRDGWAKV
jgi:hypothetical protein